MSTSTIRLNHDRGMHFVATTASGHDVDVDDGVGDTGGRPTELALAALAACSAMDVVSLLAKKRQPYSTYSVHATGAQRDAYPQVFTRIDLVHEVGGMDVETAQVRRCIELSALKYCPLNAMVSAGDTEVHHRYRIARGPDGSAVEEGEVVVTGPHWRPEAVAG